MHLLLGLLRNLALALSYILFSSLIILYYYSILVYNAIVFTHCIGSASTLVYKEINEPLGFPQDEKKTESSDKDLDIVKFTIWALFLPVIIYIEL